jgi:hypothetical protein
MMNWLHPLVEHANNFNYARLDGAVVENMHRAPHR